MLKYCEGCKKETLFTVEAVYDGFVKTGENATCSECGRVSDTERSAPEKKDPLAGLFGEDATPEKLEIFDVEAETSRLCRKCAHYVIHPFTQRCGLHDREVSATDSCPQWEANTS